MTVRGKEQELLAAREERDRNERRWGRDTPAVEVDAERKRDKERIRALEREIALLKEEVTAPSPSPSLLSQYSSNLPGQLAKRPVGSGRGTSSMPHPPPPPPPPAPPPAHVLASRSSGIDTDTLFGSARASLRHTVLPVEAPINPVASGPSRRQGQPTVNVPSDKMAAFLNEIKTAKLRKVGSVQGLSRSHSDMGKAPGGRPSGLPRRASAGGMVGFSTTSAQLARIGAKRKRSELGDLTRREAPGVFMVPTSSSLSFIHSLLSSRQAPITSGVQVDRCFIYWLYFTRSQLVPFYVTLAVLSTPVLIHPCQ